MDQPPPDLIRFTLDGEGLRTEMILGSQYLEQAASLFSMYGERQLIIVTDTNVGPRYADPLAAQLAQNGCAVNVLMLPSGEEAKTIENLLALYDACIRLQLERSAVVVAVGGGVVGDVAGMLAGTFLRGLEFVQVPTSLVSMVTASVGGKVGINYGGAKNIIGMFKHPALVLADTATLTTLPLVELRSGLGELVTVGVLGAPAIFEHLEAHGATNLPALIAQAIRCKWSLVVADPNDQHGIRAKLNLGHTFGHALEKLSNFSLPHGLAVAVGLHTACQIATAINLCSPVLLSRVQATLRRLDLPLGLSGYSAAAVIDAMRADKKRAGGKLHWVLPTALGDVQLVSEDRVPTTVLVDVLTRTLMEGET